MTQRLRVSCILGCLVTASGAAGRAQSPAARPSAAPAAAGSFPGQWAPRPAEWKYPAWPSGCGRFQGEEKAACLQFVAYDFGGLARFAPANALLGPPDPARPRVVFFGDSITDNWSAPGHGGFFPGRPYVNRGISGQTTAQMLVRFRADVVWLRPKALVILAGTNDLAGNSGPATTAEVEDNLASMCELARASGIEVVLASLLPVADDTRDGEGHLRIQSQQRPPVKIQELNRWLADYARRQGHVYLDYFSALADADGRFKPTLTDDGLHPNAAGYAVMAPLAEKAIAQALATPH